MQVVKDALVETVHETRRDLERRRYRPLVKQTEKQFTLGIVYPSGELDADKEFATAEELELAAWRAIARGCKAGIGHAKGTENAGVVVESYIWRAGPTKLGNGVVHPGDWVAGVLWTDAAWALIKAGKLRGYSFEGTATSRPRKRGQ